MNRIPIHISALAKDPVKALQAFNLMRFGTTLLIGIVLAKSGMPTEEISLYETWLFLANIVTFFWMGGGHNALISLFPTLEDDRSRATLLFQSFVVYSVLAILAVLLLAWGGHWIGPRFAHAEQVPYLGWLAIFILGNIPSQLVHLFYLLQEKPRSILGYGALSFGLQLVAILLPLLAGWGLEGIFVSLAFWALLKWAWLFVLVIRLGVWRWDGRLLKRFLWLMLPLTLHILVGNSVEYTDGLIVAGFFDDERQFALFRFGARELPLTLLLVGGIVTGLIPVAARDLQAGVREIRARTASLSHWLYPLSGALMWLSPLLFPLVYNEDFSISARVFNIYLLILSSRILLPQVVVISQQKNFVLVTSALLETAVNIGLSLWWVRIWGLEGIAMASVVAFFLNKVILIAYNFFALGIPVQAYVPVRTWVMYTAGLLFFYLAANWFYGS